MVQSDAASLRQKHHTVDQKRPQQEWWIRLTSLINHQASFGVMPLLLIRRLYNQYTTSSTSIHPNHPIKHPWSSRHKSCNPWYSVAACCFSGSMFNSSEGVALRRSAGKPCNYSLAQPRGCDLAHGGARWVHSRRGSRH